MSQNNSLRKPVKLVIQKKKPKRSNIFGLVIDKPEPTTQDKKKESNSSNNNNNNESTARSKEMNPKVKKSRWGKSTTTSQPSSSSSFGGNNNNVSDEIVDQDALAAQVIKQYNLGMPTSSTTDANEYSTNSNETGQSFEGDGKSYLYPAAAYKKDDKVFDRSNVLKTERRMQRSIKKFNQGPRYKPLRSRKDPDYDSDEEREHYSKWVHERRKEEMKRTLNHSIQLTEVAKHSKVSYNQSHMDTFIPDEVRERFNKEVEAAKNGTEIPELSDYYHKKLTQENVGYQLVQDKGWNEGEGLGINAQGIKNPINRGDTSNGAGVGAQQGNKVDKVDNEFDLYRKRMMLAYKYRPNPLNNPRRPY